MATHNDVPHPKRLHGILENSEAVEVHMQHLIGDIAMDKDFARQNIDDFVGRNAAVGATDPQDFRRLLLCQFAKEIRAVLEHSRRPFAIVLEQPA